jgi:SAM-dependent methyltransferase
MAGGDGARGYPLHEAYPSSWHGFLSPAQLRIVCAQQGLASAVDESTPLSIAEVGCGTGYAACLLAAGQPHWQVLGLDVNPAHIAEARSMARAAGIANVRFVELDLAAFDKAAASALPPFDLVTAHGLWSWVDDEVRAGLLRLLRLRLQPGGLVVLSYNALPGAADGLSLSRLLRPVLAEGGAGPAAAAELVQRLRAAGAPEPPPSVWREMLAGERLGASAAYLLHEFSTAHWRPCFFADVADALAGAGCDHVGSALPDENIDSMVLTEPQQAVRDALSDSRMRELVSDLCVRRHFRCDLFVRGARPVNPRTALAPLRLALARRHGGEPALRTLRGPAALPRPLVEAVQAALAAGPQSLADLCALPACAGSTAAELAAVLMESGCAAPVWLPPVPLRAQAREAARRLNAVAAARLAPQGRGGGQLGLATPMLGGALRASALELAVAQRLADLPPGTPPPVETLAARLWQPGPAPDAAALDALHTALAGVLRECLPAWQALGIVGAADPFSAAAGASGP